MPMAMKMWKAMKMATAMTVSGCCWLDRRMVLVAIVLLAKRLIDIIRVVDNSLLAGLRHSLGRWRGLQPKMGLKRSHAFLSPFQGEEYFVSEAVPFCLCSTKIQRANCLQHHYHQDNWCHQCISFVSMQTTRSLCCGCAFKNTYEAAASAAMRCC